MARVRLGVGLGAAALALLLGAAWPPVSAARPRDCGLIDALTARLGSARRALNQTIKPPPPYPASRAEVQRYL
ncbi:MAG: hypothetical protein KKC37_09740, partial [Proteobacteria bacterium]|nr:hypothetical protein [Pseudomonadota bacterium]